jgi:RNA polymerase II elongation factor ELL
MPPLTIPESGLSLGSGQNSAKSDLPYPDIFTLTLADSVIEDMIKCVRDGKTLQLSLGNDPVSDSLPLVAIDFSWLRN